MAELIDIAFDIKPISLENAMDDYVKLVMKTENQILWGSCVGNKATDYFFFVERLQMKTWAGLTFLDWVEKYQDKGYVQNIVKTRDNLYAGLHDAFRMYSGSGGMAQFKPVIAKKIYYRFKPRQILDFCAGWGGRCLGAMSLGIDYIGIDQNVDLASQYSAMVDLYPSKSKIQMFYQDCVDFPYDDYDYDFVFTSPPYFHIERYKHSISYQTRTHFNELFFFPVVKRSFGSLATGGHYGLNLPHQMYTDICTVLGVADIVIPLKIQHANRPGKKYTEFIYFWFKRKK